MGVKIIDLNQAPGLQSADVFPISQDIAGTRETKRATIQQLTTYLNYIPKPSVASDGQVLTYDYTTSTWVASAGGAGDYIPKPTSPTDKQVLTYDNNTNTWVANSLSNIGSGEFIPKPASANNKQVLAYDGSTNTWGASSLASVGFDALLSNDGWQGLPNGFIMQWGRVLNVSGDTSTSVIFPIAFPNSVFSVIISFNYDGVQVDHSQAVNTRNITISGFDAESQWLTSDFPIKTGNIYWQAFGN